MKKLVCIILVLVLIAGCAESENPAETYEESAGINEESIQAVNVDIDLTQFSTTMAYAALNDIFRNPDEYIGNVIRTNGFYESFFIEITGREHHYITIEGASGCCPKYIMLEWDGDFPEPLTRINLTGVFGLHEEAGALFFLLTVIDLGL